MNQEHANASHFFHQILRWRWPLLALSLMTMALFAAQLPSLVKDTRPEAFVPKDSPTLQYRDQVEDIFGLKDPMVIALIDDNGVFTPAHLQVIDWLTQRVQRIAGIDPERVTSLATENDIRGNDDGLEVEPFWEQPPTTQAQADAVWQAVQKFPLYLGSLVARDGSGSLIVAELLDHDDAKRIYFDLLALTQEAQDLLPPGAQLHVAGQGAVSGYLSAYIDADAARLNPMAAVIISLVLLVAFRSFAGVLVPNIIVLGTVSVGLGSMAAAGVPYYVITNSLPVILIGIAVCDAIHIFSQYYEELALNPGLSQRDAIVRAMSKLWRPVTLTTLTTVAGFVGLAAAAELPPMKAYGVFAALGILAAWAWTLLLLPALLSFMPARATPALRPRSDKRPDVFTRAMNASGRWVSLHSGRVLALSGVLLIVGIVGASQVSFNDQRIHSFHPAEPLRIADTAINQSFDGSYYLDVAITTPAAEDLFLPANLRWMERLQQWMQYEGGLVSTQSIVDYVKQMHRAVNNDDPAYYAIPDDPDLIAQYFLLYSASADPSDFEEEIDYDYRQAHIRGRLKDDNFQHIEPLVLALKQQLTEQFNNPNIQGHVTGSLALTQSWLAPLGPNTAQGMGLALALVCLVSALFFRSLLLGLLATLPVAFAVLMVFAVMGFADIWIGVGTSMFAAIAIGLGVDFAIHTLDRLRELIQQQRKTYAEALQMLYPTTGRALLFNLLALALGFGVLMNSKVPPLQNFGLLVAIAVLTSFAASLTVMPALIAVLRPRALFGSSKPSKQANLSFESGHAQPALLTAIAVVALLLGGVAQAQPQVQPRALPDGDAVMAAVDARDEGQTLRSRMAIELTDRRDRVRQQEAVSLRKYFGQDRRQALYYLEPSNVRDTGFLTHDYADPARDDDQWLYLPALRKTRRISASDRGDYFLGTDLTYEDLKRPGKISLSDWQFKTLAQEDLDGTPTWLIEGTPVSDEIAEELGYGRARWHVDPISNVILRSDTWDIQGNALKTAVFSDVRQVDGIWTVHSIRVENHKTGHRTQLTISDAQYNLELDDGLFEERALRRGYKP